jgi:hypothetical protein
MTMKYQACTWDLFFWQDLNDMGIPLCIADTYRAIYVYGS